MPAASQPQSVAAAPRALADIIGNSVANHLAVSGAPKMDAPLRIVGGSFIAHNYIVGELYVDPNCLSIRDVIRNLGVECMVEPNATTFNHSKKDPMTCQGGGVVVVVRSIVVMNEKVIATFCQNPVVKSRDIAVVYLYV